MEEGKKLAKNLFKKLLTDANSVFSSAEKINKTLLNKARKSFYEKDKVFYKLYARIEDQNISDDDKVKVPFYNPFLERKKDTDRSSALCSIKGPFELVHADVANISFFSKFAVNPSYCLLCVDLFSSKVHVYTMKKRSLLAKKLALFYE